MDDPIYSQGKKSGNEFWTACGSLGTSFEQRAKGVLPEMESSKSVARLIKSLCEGQRISLLDAGCGVGHYFVSLKREIPDIEYEGCDVTPAYVERAKKIWEHEPVQFRQGEIGRLPYANSSFDYVMCNNVILHIPPPIFTALRDLLRVAKEVVIIRTPVAERTYFIKELRNYDEEIMKLEAVRIDLKNLDDTNAPFNFFNLYEKRYLTELIMRAAKELGQQVGIEYRRDEDFVPFDNMQETKSRTATRVIDGKQISGSIILDWHYIIVRKSYG